MSVLDLLSQLKAHLFSSLGGLGGGPFSTDLFPAWYSQSLLLLLAKVLLPGSQKSLISLQLVEAISPQSSLPGAELTTPAVLKMAYLQPLLSLFFSSSLFVDYPSNMH